MLAVIPFVLRIKSLNVPLYDNGTIYICISLMDVLRNLAEINFFLVRKNPHPQTTKLCCKGTEALL